MPLAPPGPITPSVWGGDGKAALLRTNEQQYLLQNASKASISGLATIAVQLERVTKSFYPFGASVQVWFTDVNLVAADPGAFTFSVQVSDVDVDGLYCTLTGVTSTTGSSGFSARVELPWLWAKYLRVIATSLTNSVFANVLVTR